MIKILLADDHTLITEGISNLLEDQLDIIISGICSNGKEVIRSLEKSTDVDLILLDIDMPIMNGLECAEELKSRFPSISVAMLTMHQEKAMIKRFIELGAKGYFLKTISKEELILAIHQIAKGGEYFTSEVTKSLISDDAPTPTLALNPLLKELSEREKEIIIQIASGLSNKEIGEKLFISPRTVDTHRTNLMKKLGVNNVAGVVRFAFQNGLID